MKTNELVIYQTDEGAIQLRADVRENTLWATQRQLSEVFTVDVRTINEHIKNIFSEGELEESPTLRKFRIVQKEGSREVERKVAHYNLNMILSVGYRVNSKTATKFRQWATQTLNQHITQGYTINQHLLDEKRISAEQIINNIQQLSRGNSQIQVDDVLELVKSFTHTWFSLQSYDEGGLPEKGLTEKNLDIQTGALYQAIGQLKTALKGKGEATDLFAQEKTKDTLGGIVGSVMQSVFGEDAYPSIEEKAAHLLYFVIKSHPFNDGNKRSGAFSFIWFLQQAKFPLQNYLNPNTLTALTLLIAESDPKQKQQMIGLVLQLLRDVK